MVVISIPVYSPPSHPFIFNFPVSDNNYFGSCDMPTFAFFTASGNQSWRSKAVSSQACLLAGPTLLVEPCNPTHFWYIYLKDECSCSPPLYLDTLLNPVDVSYFNLHLFHQFLVLLISSAGSMQFMNTHLLQTPVATQSLSLFLFSISPLF